MAASLVEPMTPERPLHLDRFGLHESAEDVDNPRTPERVHARTKLCIATQPPNDDSVWQGPEPEKALLQQLLAKLEESIKKQAEMQRALQLKEDAVLTTWGARVRTEPDQEPPHRQEQSAPLPEVSSATCQNDLPLVDALRAQLARKDEEMRQLEDQAKQCVAAKDEALARQSAWIEQFRSRVVGSIALRQAQFSARHKQLQQQAMRIEAISERLAAGAEDDSEALQAQLLTEEDELSRQEAQVEALKAFMAASYCWDDQEERGRDTQVRHDTHHVVAPKTSTREDVDCDLTLAAPGSASGGGRVKSVTKFIQKGRDAQARACANLQAQVAAMDRELREQTAQIEEFRAAAFAAERMRRCWEAGQMELEDCMAQLRRSERNLRESRCECERALASKSALHGKYIQQSRLLAEKDARIAELEEEMAAFEARAEERKCIMELVKRANSSIASDKCEVDAPSRASKWRRHVVPLVSKLFSRATLPADIGQARKQLEGSLPSSPSPTPNSSFNLGVSFASAGAFAQVQPPEASSLAGNGAAPPCMLCLADFPAVSGRFSSMPPTIGTPPLAATVGTFAKPSRSLTPTPGGRVGGSPWLPSRAVGGSLQLSTAAATAPRLADFLCGSSPASPPGGSLRVTVPLVQTIASPPMVGRSLELGRCASGQATFALGAPVVATASSPRGGGSGSLRASATAPAPHSTGLEESATVAANMAARVGGAQAPVRGAASVSPGITPRRVVGCQVPIVRAEIVTGPPQSASMTTRAVAPAGVAFHGRLNQGLHTTP
mmetsp:Transcript_123154/g.353808  ORF Transcript_123154/g.353808 Transcript_123154/m.353808 type:complete len:781 (-) Transcript_123154:266-2608(-)